MKYLFPIIFFAIFFCSCSKSKSSNILVGKWSQMEKISQYTNPYTLKVEHDTLAGNSFSIEFKNDGAFFINGAKDGTYTLSNNTTFSLQPFGKFIYLFL